MDPEHGPHEGAHQHGEIGALRGELRAQEERHRAELAEVRAEAAAIVEGIRSELRESAAVEHVEDQGATGEGEPAGSELEPPEVPVTPPAPKEPKERGMWDRYH